MEAINWQLKCSSALHPDKRAPAVPGETPLVFNFYANFQFIESLKVLGRKGPLEVI